MAIKTSYAPSSFPIGLQGHTSISMFIFMVSQARFASPHELLRYLPMDSNPPTTSIPDISSPLSPLPMIFFSSTNTHLQDFSAPSPLPAISQDPSHPFFSRVISPLRLPPCPLTRERGFIAPSKS